MPEWTGAKRDELYQCLAQGRIVDAQAIAEKYKDLKQNDFRPVDKKALNHFKKHVATDRPAQHSLARMLIHESQTIRRLGCLLFSQLTEFPGDVFFATWVEYITILDSRLIQRRREDVKNNWNFYREDYERKGWTLEKIMTGDIIKPITCVSYINKQEYAMIEALLEAICACPSREGLEVWTEAGKRLNASLRGISRLMEKIELAQEKIRLSPSEAPPLKPSSGKWDATCRERLLSLMTDGDLPRIREMAQLFPRLKQADLVFQDGDLMDRAARYLAGDQTLQLTLVEMLNEGASLNAIAFAWLGMVDPVPRPIILQALLKLMETSYVGHWEGSDYCYSIHQKKLPLYRQLMHLLLQHPDLELFSTFFADHKLIRGYECLKEVLLTLHDRYCLDDVRRILDELAQQCDALPESIPEDQENKKKLKAYLRDDLPGCLELALSERDPLQAVTSIKTLRDDYSRRIREDDEYAAELVSWFAADHPSARDKAYRIAFHRPDLIRRMGVALVQLTAQGFWLKDNGELKNTVFRLHALAEYGRCTPAEAGAALEQAFTIEEPSLWRAAAEALKALRKKDPSLSLQDPARVRELLARDPEKYGKFLNPLL